jgi:hypothetical protein
MPSLPTIVCYLFAACLCAGLIIGVFAITWIVITKCERLYAGFQMSRYEAPVTVLDDMARQQIEIRDRQDRERLERVKQRLIEKRELNVVVASNLKYFICDRKGPAWFAGIRFGLYGDHEPKILFSPFRSTAKELSLRDALKFWNLFDPCHAKLVLEVARPELSSQSQMGEEVDVTSELLAMGGMEA